MFIVRSYLGRYIWVGKDCQVTIGCWGNDRALNILFVAKTNLDRGVPDRLEQLSARMFVEHAFAECTKLLPLVPTVLIQTKRTKQSEK